MTQKLQKKASNHAPDSTSETLSALMDLGDISEYLSVSTPVQDPAFTSEESAGLIWL